MIHFAPGFEGLKENLTLIDSEKLIERAGEIGIEHIFCGHTHMNKEFSDNINNNVQILCAGTSSCVSKDDTTTVHKRMIIVEDGNISIESEDYFYDREIQSFVK